MSVSASSFSSLMSYSGHHWNVGTNPQSPLYLCVDQSQYGHVQSQLCHPLIYTCCPTSSTWKLASPCVCIGFKPCAPLQVLVLVFTLLMHMPQKAKSGTKLEDLLILHLIIFSFSEPGTVTNARKWHIGIRLNIYPNESSQCPIIQLNLEKSNSTMNRVSCTRINRSWLLWDSCYFLSFSKLSCFKALIEFSFLFQSVSYISSCIGKTDP